MRVLVVDDESDLRMLMRIHLERAGHSVVEAVDGEAALRYLTGADADVDLVLLDVRMPRVDGWQVLAQLNEAGRLEDLPVIVVSAYADPGLRQRTLDLGGRAYLSKPFGRPELLELIDEVVSPA